MALTISTGSPTFTPYQGGALTSGAAVGASGTAVDFTGIPSWVKRITVMLNGVSTNGGSDIIIQIGSGSVTTTGYVCGFTYWTGGSPAISSRTTAIATLVTNSSSDTKYGHAIITNVSGNVWVASSQHATLNSLMGISSGGITLGGALDRIRITTVNGTDTFDAGSINILYE